LIGEPRTSGPTLFSLSGHTDFQLVTLSSAARPERVALLDGDGVLAVGLHGSMLDSVVG
jgi:hypothetical protein